MSKEIVMACIKYCDRLYAGFNHTECFNKLNKEEMIIVHSRLEEGFVDSDGNFVDRKQAMIIAKEENQVKSEKTTLMSEDLYLDWLKKQNEELQDLNKALKMACETLSKMGSDDCWGCVYQLTPLCEACKKGKLNDYFITKAKENESE